MTHVTCRLTAKNRDKLRNRTLDKRVWATFTFTSKGRGGEPTSKGMGNGEMEGERGRPF